MSAAADAGTYAGSQKFLHWFVALVIIVMLPAGFLMANVMPNGAVKNAVYELHKTFGIIAFFAAIVRIGLRWYLGAPPLVSGMPAWQRAAAHGSHIALYALIVLVPLTGWAGTSACCAPVNLFWTFPLTLPVSGGMETGKVILGWHEAFGVTLALLVAVHIGAALHHHIVRKDGTQRRMMPDRSRP
jgi:cytochrome b561